MDKPRRYTTLEAMRGVGAIYVVLLHGERVFGVAAPQSAYLGVDFFFVLSGFIVAHVYAKPLDNGLSAVSFLGSRLLRLYPVYLLGTLSGVALALESKLVGHSDNLLQYTQPLISLPFALGLLPSPVSDAMFPLDIPAWSLLLEFIINVAFAAAWFRTTRALFTVMMLSAVVLLVGLFTRGDLNFGWNKATAFLGLARIGLSFPLGVFIHRFHDRSRLPSWFFPVPILALAALVYAEPTGPARIAFNIAFIGLISPLLVLTGAACSPRNLHLQRLFIALGAMSYPLYALHFPMLMAVMGTISRHVPPGPATVVASVTMLIVMVGVASYVARLDSRLRSYVTRRRQRSFEGVRAA